MTRKAFNQDDWIYLIFGTQMNRERFDFLWIFYESLFGVEMSPRSTQNKSPMEEEREFILKRLTLCLKIIPDS